MYFDGSMSQGTNRVNFVRLKHPQLTNILSALYY